jgi:hypothetical protein
MHDSSPRNERLPAYQSSDGPQSPPDAISGLSGTWLVEPGSPSLGAYGLRLFRVPAVSIYGSGIDIGTRTAARSFHLRDKLDLSDAIGQIVEYTPLKLLPMRASGGRVPC